VKTQDVLPALLSIIVIILVTIMEKQSKLFAALMATMHLAAPLALRIVYSSEPFIRTAANFRLLIRVNPNWFTVVTASAVDFQEKSN
jgi:hypothetical protein